MSKFLMWRRTRDREFSVELQSHLDMHIADNIREGMTPEEARRQALVALGGVEQTKERYRAALTFRWIDALVKDIQFGLRTLRRSSGFTTLAIVTLAVGIAATNTAFTIMNAVMIRSLPFDEAERLVEIGAVTPGDGDTSMSYADFKDWERSIRAFTGIAASQTGTMNVSDDERAPERFFGTYVSAQNFSLLRTKPVLGRDFLPEEDRPGGPPVAIISFRLWKGRYAGDPRVLGRVIRVNARPATIVGVMPEGMEFPANTAIWQPLALTPGIADQPRDARTLGVFGRLADGVSAADATIELDRITAALAKDFPQTNKDTRARIERLRPGIGAPWIVVFGALMSAVGLLLLVSCVNVANLLLARAAHRGREVSIRASLGATRWRIVRQLLVESLILAVAAGLVALPLSAAALRLFVSLTDEIGRPHWMDFSMDANVFMFLSAVCLGTAVVSGLAPSLQLSRAGANDMLKKSAGRTVTSTKWTRRLSGALVVVEVVLTVVLVAGAAAMMRYYSAQMDVTRDVDTSRMLTMNLRLPNETYPTAAERAAFYRRLEERLGSMRNTSAIAVAGAAPFLRQSSRGMSVDGHLPAEGERLPMVDVLNVGPRYFETLGLGVTRGRDLREEDRAPGREAVVVDQRFIDRFFPQREPLGASVSLIVDRTARPVTIVGVVPALGVSDMGSARPLVYRPFENDPPPNMTLVARVRTEGDAAPIAAVLREEVRRLDPDLPLYDVRTLNDVLSWLLWANRVFGGMFAIFAGIAVLVATVGIYGVVSFATAQRTQEIGIRMALGAPRARLWWTMMASRIAQVAIGLGVGVVAAFVLLGLMGGLLVGGFGQDPLTLAASGGFLFLVSVVSMLWPVWRATSRSPVVALRYE
jgi:putative ABC transport system permease protein